jgi:hypothetical protein
MLTKLLASTLLLLRIFDDAFWFRKQVPSANFAKFTMLPAFATYLA